MGAVEEIIIAIVKKNDKSLGWLAEKVGMSRSGFNKMLENGSLRVDTLIKIAEIFNIHPSTFFENRIILDGNKVHTFKDRNTYKQRINILMTSIMDILSEAPELSNREIVDKLLDGLDKITKARQEDIEVIVDTASKEWQEDDEVSDKAKPNQ